MALRIPESHKGAISQIATLPDSDIDDLVRGLANARAGATPRALAESVAQFVALPLDQVVPAMTILVSLFVTSVHLARDVADIAQDVAAAAIEQKVSGVDQASSPRLRDRLIRLLRNDAALSLTSRAYDLYFAHDQLFSSARVLSDMRTVFTPDSPAKPLGAVVVHNLELAASKNGETNDSYFALNVHDLRQLRRVVDRALEKHETLVGLIDKAGLVYLEDVPNDHQRR